MTSRARMLAALTGARPDRLPVTTHHVMPFYLDRCLNGISIPEFFDKFSLDAILIGRCPTSPPRAQTTYMDPLQGYISFLESPRVTNDAWRIFPAGCQSRRAKIYSLLLPEHLAEFDDCSGRSGIHRLGRRAAD